MLEADQSGLASTRAIPSTARQRLAKIFSPPKSEFAFCTAAIAHQEQFCDPARCSENAALAAALARSNRGWPAPPYSQSTSHSFSRSSIKLPGIKSL